ncbi:hypothetical protein FACS1894181_13930 [Bacteroidia bacterium]|nr:hypothetical protein FACS1894181_13930 [Bacteroidia bacterium]
MAKSNREVSDIDEQALLNIVAGYDSFTKPNAQTTPAKQTVITVPDEPTVQSDNIKRMSGKQRKLALDEFRQQFMQTSKIENRKPVFIILSICDSLERIVRLFGKRSMSVSGLVENLARNFLETYKDDVEQWRKL